jgi:hypothetical protein
MSQKVGQATEPQSLVCVGYQPRSLRSRLTCAPRSTLLCCSVFSSTTASHLALVSSTAASTSQALIVLQGAVQDRGQALCTDSPVDSPVATTGVLRSSVHPAKELNVSVVWGRASVFAEGL